MSTNLGDSHDVVVVGGGPAGLSAALTLGRQARQVLVFDTAAPANAVSGEVHGALGFDGVPPRDLRGTARSECERYSSVRFEEAEVVAVEPTDGTFRVAVADGQEHRARKVILACGRRYELPEIRGARELFGSQVLHCPFCHGWESRGTALAVIGGDPQSFHLAVMLRRLTDDLVFCTNGSHELEDGQVEQLQDGGVALNPERVTEIEGLGDEIELRFDDDGSLRRHAVFLHHTPADHEFVERLGLDRKDDGRIDVDDLGQTSIPGLHAAGDLCAHAQVALAISSGAFAGGAVSVMLAYEDLAQGN